MTDPTTATEPDAETRREAGTAQGSGGDTDGGWSLNSMTVPLLTLPELLTAAVTHHYPAIGLWRDHFDDHTAEDADRQIQDAGLRVSSVCRAGLFTHADANRRDAAVADSFVAVEQAATLRAAALVVVPGGVVGRDLAGSRAMVRDGLGRLAGHAKQHGVRLAIEPMHPMLAQARSCITSVREALDLLDELGLPAEAAGLAYDSYHVWWDADLDALGPRLAGRLASVQVADWLDPDHGVTTSRGIPGEGCINFPAFLDDAHRLGYRGDVEIEVLSEPWWQRGADATLTALAAALRPLSPTGATPATTATEA